MGFGLNLGIPDPRQWKKQQVSKAVIDEERVSISPSLEIQKYHGSEFSIALKMKNVKKNILFKKLRLF